MKEKSLSEVVCRGTHYEMGLRQGKYLHARWKEILAALLGSDLAPKWLRVAGPGVLKAILKVQGFRVRRKNLDNMLRFAPFQLERMRGIADGAGLDFSLLLGLSSIETLAAHFQYLIGCTSLGVGKKRSKTGRPILGYNHDFPNFLKDHLFIRHSRPKHGYFSVQLTYPTLPGAICGVNQMGVAVSLNHAFTTEPFNDGVPPTMLVQEGLDRCKTAEEVVRLFRKTKFSCGSMATVLDKKGGLYAMELSRGRFGVRHPKEDVSLTLNAYQLDPLRDIEVPQEALFHPKKFPRHFHGIPIHLSNWERRDRFDVLLKGRGKIGPEELRHYLSDHFGASGGNGDVGTICRHHPTTDTIATALVDPAKGTLDVARGYACRAVYQRFSVY